MLCLISISTAYMRVHTHTRTHARTHAHTRTHTHTQTNTLFFSFALLDLFLFLLVIAGKAPWAHIKHLDYHTHTTASLCFSSIQGILLTYRAVIKKNKEECVCWNVVVSARKVGLNPKYVFWSHLVESLYANPELLYAYLVSESGALL